jgi:CheY-like chemotaxis protein
MEQIAGRRILLVEDNELNRLLAVEILQGEAGAQVEWAADGAQGVQRALADAFDIVLMDVQMPVMDGLEATLRLRAEPSLAGLAIVGMTAHAMASDHDRCRAAGMNDIVVKPFAPEELFRVIARWLPKRARAVEDSAAAPVSIALGLQYCMGRHDLYLDIVQAFLRAHGQDAERLLDARQSGDLAQMSALTHALASTARVVGAEGLADVVVRLGEALRRGDAEARSRLVEEVVSRHVQAVHALTEYAARQAPKAP